MTDQDFKLSSVAPQLLAELIAAARDGVLAVGDARRIVYANPAICEIVGCSCGALLGRDVLQFFAANEHAPLIDHLAPGAHAPADRRSAVLLRPDGEEREVEYTTHEVSTAARPLVFLHIRDVTDTRRVIRWAAALAQIASTVALAHSLDTTLDALARSLVNATGASASLIALVDPATDQLQLAGVHGLNTPHSLVEQLWLAPADAPAYQALREGRTVVVRDLQAYLGARPEITTGALVIGELTWGTAVCMPLVSRRRTVGVLTCAYPRLRPPGEAEVAFLSAIADQAAIAVENTRLLAQAQEKAVLEERQRLARELHDSVSQALYGIALGARTARNLIERDPARVIEPIDYVLSLADTGLAEMRALIFELRPESLQTEGLVAALEKQTAAIRARYGLEVNVQLCAEPQASLVTKEALYRIAQEALNNTVKHARASRIDLRLATVADPAAAVLLDVRDNGVGFDPADTFPGHLGLRSMRERAARLGGSLTCASAAGQGAHISVRLPLN